MIGLGCRNETRKLIVDEAAQLRCSECLLGVLREEEDGIVAH